MSYQTLSNLTESNYIKERNNKNLIPKERN